MALKSCNGYAQAERSRWRCCRRASTDWRQSDTCWKAVGLMISSKTMGTLFAVRST